MPEVLLNKAKKPLEFVDIYFSGRIQELSGLEEVL